MRRTSSLSVFVGCGLFPALGLAAATLGGGCGASPAITVVHLAPGDTPDVMRGDPVKIRRGNQEEYVGVRGGFYVVRSAEDWRGAWPGAAERPLPATLDTTHSMLLVAVAQHKDTTDLKIDKIVETGNVISVWTRETRAGEGCTARPERPPVDGVVAPRIDKPVKFYVSEERAASCGQAPGVIVNCRAQGTPTWSAKVLAKPGDTIDCEMSAEARGKFAITDRVLMLDELPAGSSTKMAYSKAPIRGAFVIDVFGVYGVHAEAVDEGGRKMQATASVEVAPPKTKDVVVQLAWTDYDPVEGPTTAPRVKLRALDDGSEVCAADAPRATLCEVNTHGAFTHMLLKASDKRVPLEVLYIDERSEKGPLVCLHVYFEGKRTAETCDRKPRGGDERWRVGVVDMATGKLGDPPPVPIDAGADAAGDSGVKRPPFKGPVKK